jgi:ferric-dicitrate binding protein FerR (iron transport regulator)
MNEDYLIEKWLNDELTADELEDFKKLENYQLYIDIIENAKLFKAESFSRPENYDSFSKRIKETKIRKLNWVRPLMQIAGVLIIGIGIYLLFFMNNMIDFQTANAESISVELPDRSIVELNALSQLSYNKRTWDSSREVILKGEAFFKVSKGSTFEVITSVGKVSVLGTQFNVKQRDDFFEVKCFEGVVEVSSMLATKKLLAGDTFRIYGDSVSYDKTSNTYPEWTTNRSTFESIPLIEVIEELKRQYNIQIEYNTIDTNRIFTGGFVHDDLENALNSVTRPMDLTYIIENSNQVRLLRVDQ